MPPIFSYQARDQRGQLVKGKLHARSKSAVADQLLENKVLPVCIDLISAAENDMQSLLKKLGIKKLGIGKVKLDEFILFFRQMHALTRAGLTITISLTRLAASSRSKVFAQALEEVAQHVSAGLSLSESMRAVPEVFSPMILGTIAAGESSGQLENTFLELATYLSFENKALRRIKSALRYPMMVIGSVIAAVIVLTTVVIPAYAELFISLKAQLPLPTRIILSVSNFMVQNGALLFVLLLLLKVCLSIEVP